TQLARLNQESGNLWTARNYIVQADRLVQSTPDPVQQGFVTIHLAAIEWELGNHESALTDYQRALTYGRAGNSWWIQAQALNGLGKAAQFQGNVAEALPRYVEALQVARAHSDAFSEIEILVNIARAQRDRGDLDSARLRLNDAIAKIETLRETLSRQDLRT